jgi:hypothetical protein
LACAAAKLILSPSLPWKKSVSTLPITCRSAALEFTRNLATRVIYWPTLDPTAVQGARETILDAYRGVRDGLQQRIKEFLGWHPVGST